MKMKTFILVGTLIFSLFCACSNSNNVPDSSNTESAVLENSTASGNFSDPVYIANPGTDTIIVEMP